MSKGGEKTVVYTNLMEIYQDLQGLLQEFYSLGEEMASIFLYYLLEQGKKYANTWFDMKTMLLRYSDFIKYDIGTIEDVIRGLKETLKDWDNLHMDLTVKFNGGFYSSKQWIYWKKFYELIRKLENLIDQLSASR